MAGNRLAANKARERFLELLEALEDGYDMESARQALAESDERIPWTKVKKRLSL